MVIVRNIAAHSADVDLVLTIGVFDGVHIGHRAVLRELFARRKPGAAVGVLTFDHHPQEFLHPGHAPWLLTTAEEKINLLDACGIDVLFLIPFDEHVQSMPAEIFLRDVLLSRLRTKLLVVGENWRFGRNRTGDCALARREFETAGSVFEAAPLLEEDGEKVSSSRIRGLIEQRRFDVADRLLGSPFTLRGSVRLGDGQGHVLGFPTVNLNISYGKLVPPAGVYAATAHHEGSDYRAAVSIGDKPTFGGSESVVEVHLLDFDRSIYGDCVAIRDWRFLREQRWFATKVELAEAIRADVKAVRGSHS
jgi:riboflavin kinase/FMN adenylyltransferase